MISLTSKTASPKFNMCSLQLFERDPDGNWTFKLFDGESAARLTEIKRYDGNGCRMESVVYSTDGSVMHTEKYKYSPVYTETPPADPTAFATAANIKKECIRNLKILECSVELYQMENGGKLPDNLEKLVECGDIDQVPRCPANGKYSFAMNDLSEDAGTPYFRVEVECGVHGGLYQP